MIPSEKGKGPRKPTVNFMQGQLLVRRLHNGLKEKKGGWSVSQTKPQGSRFFQELENRERVKRKREARN